MYAFFFSFEKPIAFAHKLVLFFFHIQNAFLPEGQNKIVFHFNGNSHI